MKQSNSSPSRERTSGIGLSLRDVRRVFDGGVNAVDCVSLDIKPGEFVAILGPSGCGKSTLLRIVAGLDHPSSGSVTAGGLSQGSDAGPLTSFVFQDAHLLPWRNVLRNVTLPLELLGAGKAERTEAANRAIAEVDLSEAILRYPAQLSGGMKMRASVARALVTRPRLLLLDEPFAALDELTRQRLDDSLRRLWIRIGMTVLFVTHSIAEAALLADRAIVFSRRPARVMLDHRLALPVERGAETRISDAYVREMRVLHDALAEGERGPA